MTDHAPGGLRETKRRELREQIRTTALDLFTTRGYQQTTLEQIASAVRIGQRTLYRYFPTKDSLVVTDEDDQAMLNRFTRELDQHPPIEALRRAFHAMLFDAETESDRDRRALIAAEPELQAAQLRLVIDLAEQYAQAIVEHTGRPEDAEAALSLTAAAAGIALVTIRSDRHETKTTQLQRFDTALQHLQDGLDIHT